jgi:hypothetical protein
LALDSGNGAKHSIWRCNQPIIQRNQTESPESVLDCGTTQLKNRPTEFVRLVAVREAATWSIFDLLKAIGYLLSRANPEEQK